MKLGRAIFVSLLHNVLGNIKEDSINNQYDHNVIAAAVLHDVVEDTSITLEILRTEFNDTICDLVAEESEDKREELPASETWLVRKEEVIEAIRNASSEAKKVALGDKLSNIRAMARDYRKSGGSPLGSIQPE